MKLASIIITCVAALLLLSYRALDAGDSGTALATVEGEHIFADEFRTRYIDYLLATGLKDAHPYRDHFLNSLIAERLIVQQARKQGIEQKEEFSEASSRIRKKLLVEAYVQKSAYDTLQIAERELQDMFVRANTTLTARHLYAPTKERADALISRLSAGESLEALAQEVFADSALANNGGLVGSFTIDEMDPAFESAAYALDVGEISQPVKTQQGYSIIQITDRFTKPIITETEYAAKRDKMLQYVTYRRKMAARSQLVDKIVSDLQPAFEEATVDWLLDQVLGEDNLPASSENRQDWLEKTLVSFRRDNGRVVWTLGDFREAARFTSEEQRARVAGRDALLQFVEGVLVREEMVSRAIEMKLDRSAEFEAVYARAERGWIWENAVGRFFEAQTAPEDTLRAHFDAFRADFTSPARTHIREIMVDTREEALRIEDALSDTSFEELARRHTIRPGGRVSNGELGYLSEDQLGLLAGRVRDVPQNQVVGPLEVAGRYVLLKVGDRQPAHSMTYEEARPEILRRLQPDAVKKNMKDEISRLRSQARVEVDEKQLGELSLEKEND